MIQFNVLFLSFYLCCDNLSLQINILSFFFTLGKCNLFFLFRHWSLLNRFNQGILKMELATLLKGAGYQIFSSEIIFQTLNILWCFRAVKLELKVKNGKYKCSSISLSKFRRHRRSFCAEIRLLNFLVNAKCCKDWLIGGCC